MSSQSKSHPSRVLAMLPAMLAVLFTVATLAVAQDQPAPKWELYGGYSFFYPGADVHGLLPGGLLPVSSRLESNPRGAGASITYDFNRWFGLTLDTSTHWGSGETGLANRIDDAAFSNLSFGPKVTFRSAHFAPFLEALVGDHRLMPDAFHDIDKLGFMVGGGLDVNVSRNVALRLIRADYVMSSYRYGPSASTPSTDLRGVRLQAGIVFNFGGERTVTLPTASCSAQPTEVWSRDAVKVTATGTNFNPKHTVTYGWTGNGGKLSSVNTESATVDTAGMAPGSYSATATITDPKEKKNNSATCTANFSIRQPQALVVSCSANPTTIAIGESSTITVTASDPQGWPLTYSWSTTGGTLSGSGTTATLTATNADAGNTITVTGTATDQRANLSASCTAQVNVPPVVKCVNIEDWGECTFEKNPKKPWRVDNDCKDTLDKLSLRLQQMPNGKLDIVGYTDEKEVVSEQTLGSQRSVNVKYYLTTDGPNKADASRIQPRQGGTKGKATHFYFVPEGSLCGGQLEEGTTVDETQVQGQSRTAAPAPRKKAKKAAAAPSGN
jgi:opacity protein-like surface antigen